MALALVVHEPDERWLARRTERALVRLGATVEIVSKVALASVLESDQSAWIVRAGAAPRELREIAPSATGRPVIALGPEAGFGGPMTPAWARVIRAGGGLVEHDVDLPSPVAAFVERPRALGRALDETDDLGRAIAAVRDRYRVVIERGAIAAFSRRPRVVLAVSTLHRGGAERVVLDLAQALPSAGIDVCVAVLDRARRETYPAPPSTWNLSHLPRAARAAVLADAAAAWGADLVHAHLLDADDLEALHGAGARVVCTAHNARPGWPRGLGEMAPNAVALFIGCSIAATRDLHAGGMIARAAWNGVHRTEARGVSERRGLLAVPTGALVLVTVANARRQKRLDRLPAVLASLVARGVDAHAVIVGGSSTPDDDAAAAERALADAIAEHRVAERVHRTGTREDVRPWLDVADVFVSTSAFEGLSLAQMEALDAGLPLVVSDVGGAREIARLASIGGDAEACHVLPEDAAPSDLADAVLRACPPATGARRSRLPPALTIGPMARRHATLYQRAMRRGAEGDGLVLVTNNFSTGGAQSSARRLLLALAARGVPCRAVVLEEQAAFPTPGRRALVDAGVPVDVAPRAQDHDAELTTAAVIRAIDRASPRAVVFWNVIPEHKVLIADQLLGARVFDVSPGEMYFRSLDRYFANPRFASPYLSALDYGALLDGVIVKYAAEAPRAAVLGAPVHVVPNGVDVSSAVPRPKRTGERLRLGTLARIGPDKKLEELFDALRRASSLPPWELLVGGAPETGSEKYAEALEVGARDLPVRWLGEVAPGEILSMLDLFVLVAEPAGCPNASLEAMAHALPVLATDVGGMSEQVVTGETGWLVARGDTDALASGLEAALAAPGRLPTMGANGLAHARARFSIERMTSDYAALFGIG